MISISSSEKQSWRPAQDKAILQLFIGVLFGWLSGTFPELSDAYKAHPKIVKWLVQQEEQCRLREEN
jgi:hypothetical protein